MTQFETVQIVFPNFKAGEEPRIKCYLLKMVRKKCQNIVQNFFSFSFFLLVWTTKKYILFSTIIKIPDLSRRGQ